MTKMTPELALTPLQTSVPQQREDCESERTILRIVSVRQGEPINSILERVDGRKLGKKYKGKKCKAKKCKGKKYKGKKYKGKKRKVKKCKGKMW
ncbi:hypothetical protein AVEN_129950-1 [Araneus ventricosus]|uniref:Uncharacterized protein n=1 Tax=Araneus ventricosus TaxID=182803 RepID=A0A4Y2NSQ6_ARAVE|nr:hypothetical protein AVEN_129950-1 [Araneus ventricosus]